MRLSTSAPNSTSFRKKLSYSQASIPIPTGQIAPNSDRQYSPMPLLSLAEKVGTATPTEWVEFLHSPPIPPR